MKVKECGEFGTIEYRLPNIPEAMMLLGRIGLNSKKLAEADELSENEFVYMAKLLEQLDTFITKINITVDDKKIKKYEDVLKEFQLMQYISEIGGEIFESLNLGGKKKP